MEPTLVNLEGFIDDSCASALASLAIFSSATASINSPVSSKAVPSTPVLSSTFQRSPEDFRLGTVVAHVRPTV